MIDILLIYFLTMLIAITTGMFTFGLILDKIGRNKLYSINENEIIVQPLLKVENARADFYLTVDSDGFIIYIKYLDIWGYFENNGKHVVTPHWKSITCCNYKAYKKYNRILKKLQNKYEIEYIYSGD